jgi:integrase
MNGSVKKVGTYARTGKPKWVARYRGPDRQERKRNFTRKVDADAWLSQRQAEMSLGDWVPPERSKRTIADISDEWLSVHTGKPSTISNYRSVLKVHILPTFGNRQVGSIERPEIRRWMTEVAASGRAPETARNALNTFKGLLSHALEVGAIKASPAARVAAPKSARREMKVATEAEVAQIAHLVGAEFSTLIFAAAYTGLRAGELLALRVGDLDFMRGRINVRRAVSEVHGALIYDTPKSGRERTVSMPPFLRDLLVEAVVEVASDPDALVFTMPSGAPIRISNFYPRVFKPAVADIGLEGLRFHDLRHACVTFLIDSGAHPRAIMERLGHSSITITMDTYGHLLPSLDDSLTDALEQRFRSGARADAR